MVQARKSKAMKRKKIIISSLGMLLGLPSFAQNIEFSSPIRTDKEQILLLNNAHPGTRHYQQAPYALVTDYLLSASRAYDVAETYYQMGYKLSEHALEYFIKKFPTDGRLDVSILHRSARYMNEGDFNRARYHLERIDETALSAEERTEWQVRLAYSLLKTNRKGGNVADLFAQASTANNHWGRVASFYIGSELMAQGKLDEAERTYKSLLSHADLEADARIGLAAVDYFRGNYEEAVAKVVAVERKNKKTASQASLLQIAGNSFYRLGDAPNTIRYFEELSQLNSSLLTSEDWLLLGAAYIENGALETSIQPLLQASVGNGFAAEVANLYLGRVRRDLGRYSESIASYEAASTEQTTSTIREAAMYEMALVMRSSGQSNFGQDVRVAERFLTLFPNSKHVPTMETFLTEFYLSNSNFATSLASIDRVKSSSPAIREATQYVLNHLALEALEKREIAEAKNFIQRAQKAPINKLYKGESLLIEADIAFAEGRYDAAVAPLKEFLNNHSTDKVTNTQEAQYRLGYAYFNSARLEEAGKHFSAFLKSNPKDLSRKSDAATRWADCRYAQNALEDALHGYEQAIQSEPQQSSYALLRSAEIYGLKKNYTRQVETLDRLIKQYPDNAIVSTALFEKGKAQLFSGNKVSAEQTLQTAFKQFGNTEAGRLAQLQLALHYYNTQRSDLALDAYATLMKMYPQSTEATTAFSNLKNMCIEMGRMDYIDRVIASTNGLFTLSDNDVRTLQFQTAEAEYRRDPLKAETSLSQFVARYQKGADVLKAQKYLADIAYQKGDEEEAYRLYSQVVSAQTELSEVFLLSSLNRLGHLQKRRKEYLAAYKNYAQVYERSSDPSSRQAAAEEAVQMAFSAQQYQSGIDFANKVLKEITEENAEKIRLYRAHCFQAMQKKELALGEYKTLSKNTDKAVGAEALVAYARLLSDNPKQRKEARKVLNQFIEKGTPHEYWLASGIILLSDIYRMDGDPITANQYLESLRNNYPNREDSILEEVNKRLSSSTESI